MSTDVKLDATGDGASVADAKLDDSVLSVDDIAHEVNAAANTKAISEMDEIISDTRTWLHTQNEKLHNALVADQMAHQVKPTSTVDDTILSAAAHGSASDADIAVLRARLQHATVHSHAPAFSSGVNEPPNMDIHALQAQTVVRGL